MDELPVDTTLISLSDEPPRPELNRRTGERHLTLFRVGSMIVNGQQELCLIRNISAGGMMLRAYCALEDGQRIKVELKHGEPVAGRVNWIGGQQVGISFDQPIDVLSFLSPAEGPQPRIPRVSTSAAASVRAGATVFRSRARDISQGGIKIEGRAGIAPGMEVVVSLPGLPPQAGVVRWSDGSLAGVTFNRLLSLPMLVEWLKAQRGTDCAA